MPPNILKMRSSTTMLRCLLLLSVTICISSADVMTVDETTKMKRRTLKKETEVVTTAEVDENDPMDDSLESELTQFAFDMSTSSISVDGIRVSNDVNSTVSTVETASLSPSLTPTLSLMQPSMAEYVSFRGIVWNDANGNGRIDDLEEGLAGVIILVKSCTTDQTGESTNDETVAFTFTKTDGSYLLKDIGPPGCYSVHLLRSDMGKGGRSQDFIMESGATVSLNVGIKLPPTWTGAEASPTRMPSATWLTAEPSDSPASNESTISPTTSPSTSEPSAEPTTSVTTVSPSASPSTSKPSAEPTTSVTTVSPSASPSTSKPSLKPTTSEPTLSPSVSPSTSKPSAKHTSSEPTMSPSALSSTSKPSAKPTSSEPTMSPSTSPSTSKPSAEPTTSVPTTSPSVTSSTSKPSAKPTTSEPTVSPSVPPTTSKPSVKPTTGKPSVSPSAIPSTIDTSINLSLMQPSMAEYVSFRGIVWNDANGNGRLDDLEEGLADAIVQVKSCTTDQTGESNNDQAIAFAFTKPDGSYLLKDIGPPGCYYIHLWRSDMGKGGRSQDIIMESGATVSLNVGIKFSPTDSPTLNILPRTSPSTSKPRAKSSSSEPSMSPSASPSTSKPSEKPSSSDPTMSSSAYPTTSKPSAKPTTGEPSMSPSVSPSTSKPSAKPSSSDPTMSPSESPSTNKPSEKPTISEPSMSPSTSPSTSKPSAKPLSGEPTMSPSGSPSTSKPSAKPSSGDPTMSPSGSPSTSKPSAKPSSGEPTMSPSGSPSTSKPSAKQSSSESTISPSVSPSTSKPSAKSTTSEPSMSPSASPSTSKPSAKPSSSQPTMSPSVLPSTSKPSAKPTTSEPTMSPSLNPSRSKPSAKPTSEPTFFFLSASPSTNKPSIHIATELSSPTSITPNPTFRSTLNPVTNSPSDGPTGLGRSSPAPTGQATWSSLLITTEPTLPPQTRVVSVLPIMKFTVFETKGELSREAVADLSSAMETFFGSKLKDHYNKEGEYFKTISLSPAKQSSTEQYTNNEPVRNLRINRRMEYSSGTEIICHGAIEFLGKPPSSGEITDVITFVSERYKNDFVSDIVNTGNEELSKVFIVLVEESIDVEHPSYSSESLQNKPNGIQSQDQKLEAPTRDLTFYLMVTAGIATIATFILVFAIRRRSRRTTHETNVFPIDDIEDRSIYLNEYFHNASLDGSFVQGYEVRNRDNLPSAAVINSRGTISLKQNESSSLQKSRSALPSFISQQHYAGDDSVAEIVGINSDNSSSSSHCLDGSYGYFPRVTDAKEIAMSVYLPDGRERQGYEQTSEKEDNKVISDREGNLEKEDNPVISKSWFATLVSAGCLPNDAGRGTSVDAKVSVGDTSTENYSDCSHGDFSRNRDGAFPTIDARDASGLDWSYIGTVGEDASENDIERKLSEETDESKSSLNRFISDLLWLERRIANDADKSKIGPGIAAGGGLQQGVDDIERSDSYSYECDSFSDCSHSADGMTAPSAANSVAVSITMRDCYIPPGKLNVDIASTKDGPVISCIRDESLYDHFDVGDLIIAVDDLDTRSLTGRQLASLLSSRSGFQRKITVLHIGDPKKRSTF
ncbi:hypothetical protein ACHAXA_000978 [Cyclostephanos tholiformis]|uniref:Circumsporozoite protein n=1 Tax=Cyclostephanos tholiformis TaxID=382380 RepID=A0ABD3SDW6_9STRA